MRSQWMKCLFVGALAITPLRGQAESEQDQPRNTGNLDESARREQAKTLFERGVALYRDERYREALNYFIGAQNLYPNSTLTFNIARTCERLSDAPCALKYYREYRRKSQNAHDLDEVDRHIAAMEHDVAAKGIQQVTLFSRPEGAQLLVDGAEKGPTPWTGELTPGQHIALLRQTGFSDLQVAFLVDAAHATDWTYELRAAPAVQEGQSGEPKLTPASEVQPAPVAAVQPQPVRAPAPAPFTTAPPRKIDIWTWVALGSGAAVLGTAGILEGARASRENDVRDSATQLDRAAAYESMKDYQLGARIAVGAGFALTAVGLTLLTLDLTRHTNHTSSVSASCAGTECRLGLSGAW